MAMPSFFEKLKKGMGIEMSEDVLEQSEEKKEPKKQEKKEISVSGPKRIKKGKTTIRKEIEPAMAEEPHKIEAVKEPETEGRSVLTQENEKKDWFEKEGELAIDVYQTDEEIVIQSAIAGVLSEDLDISIENDMAVIRGIRKKPGAEEPTTYFYQECYWGPFSREIILSEDIDSSRAQASMKEGILTIRIPRIEREKKRKLTIKE